MPAALAACANVSALEDLPDAGSDPTVASVAPAPGPVDPSAAFTVTFSAPMDEGQLLAASGRSETVALAAEADVERAAAAMEHAQLSAHERELLVAASAEVAPDRRALTLTPDQALAPGGYFLLVSPRVRDDVGRHLTAMRYAFQVAATAPGTSAQLVWPPAGGEAPSNLAVVRAHADAGRLSLVGSLGQSFAAAEAHGAVALQLAAPLDAGQTYALSLDGTRDDTQAFRVAACARSARLRCKGARRAERPRHGGRRRRGARLAGTPRRRSGGRLGSHLHRRRGRDLCAARMRTAELRLRGFRPHRRALGHRLPVQVTATDDFGHTFRGPPQPFGTLAPLPRAVLTEVMASGTAGEYVEIANFGPGAADLQNLALQGPDGVVRPLLAVAPPLPVVLAPGARALAVGGSFDASLYPAIPAGTPVLRASTQRLLGRGLSDSATPAFALVLLGAAPVELSRFPGAGLACATGQSLQRDESVAPAEAASWTCAAQGGTPGAPP